LDTIIRQAIRIAGAMVGIRTTGCYVDAANISIFHARGAKAERPPAEGDIPSNLIRVMPA
jgi:hypothetical protein